MDLTNFYYFYSTIAQVFAAILGVIGLFAVFLIENIRSRINTDTDKLWYILGDFGIFPDEMPKYRFDEKRKAEARKLFPYTTESLLAKRAELERMIDNCQKDIEKQEMELRQKQEQNQNFNMQSGTINIDDAKKTKFERESLLQQICVLESLIEKERTIVDRLGTPTYFVGLIIVLALCGIFVLPWMQIFPAVLWWLAGTVHCLSVIAIFVVIYKVISWVRMK